jgi:hypothetical protein
MGGTVSTMKIFDRKLLKQRKELPGEQLSPERLEWLKKIFDGATKVKPAIISPRKIPGERPKHI